MLQENVNKLSIIILKVIMVSGGRGVKVIILDVTAIIVGEITDAGITSL